VSHSGATVKDTQDYIKPMLRKKPKHVIIHVGTNNLRRDKPKEVKKKVVKLLEESKKTNPEVNMAVSSIVKRSDDSNQSNKVMQVNEALKEYCSTKNIAFIDNNNIDQECLNRGGLHLNKKGTITLAANFRRFITSISYNNNNHCSVITPLK